MQISPGANGEEEAVVTIRKKRNYKRISGSVSTSIRSVNFLTKIDGVEIIIIKIIEIIFAMFYY